VFRGLKVGIFNKKKKTNRTVTDEQRESSLESRRLNAELKQLKQELETEKLRQQHELSMMRLEEEKLKLQDKIADYTEYEEENETEGLSMEKILMSIITSKLAGGVLSSPLTPNSLEIDTPASPSFSDEEIQYFINQMPKAQLKQAKKMPDSLLKKTILSQVPNADEETIQRAITLIKA